MAISNISESLLKAMSITAAKAAEDLSSDKTIKAIVKKCVDASSGLYRVTYNSGTFNAYLQSGSTEVYKIGEEVYVLVPQGDMTQKKFIMGRVQEDDKDSTAVSVKTLLSDYQTIGANPVVEKAYTSENGLAVKRMQPLTLESHDISDFQYCYINEQSENYEQVMSYALKNGGHYDSYEYPVIDIDNQVFINSAEQASALLVRAKFKAALDTSSTGNYGLIVNVAFKDTSSATTDEDGNTVYSTKIISYVLDVPRMTGNPMKYYDYTSQYMYATFDGENYQYIDSIIAFSEGFVDTTTARHSGTDDTSIYIDDIEILALEEISSTSGDYKLQLTAPGGNTVSAGENTSLTIQAALTYLDENVSDNSIFYWGTKDPSITSMSDDYNAKLGTGYKYLSAAGKGSSITIESTSLTAAKTVFKCVAIYKSDIILTTNISLFNNNNKLDIAIESDQGTSFQFNEGSPTLTCTINGKTDNYMTKYADSTFSFIWSKVDDEAGTIVLNETEAELKANQQQELQEFIDDPTITTNSAGRTSLQVLTYYSSRIKQVQDVTYPLGTSGPQIQCKLKNVNTTVTYACSVYRSGVYIGYAEITLQNSGTLVNSNYYISITNGGQVFQYSESGVSPASEKNTEPLEVQALTAVFHSPQGEVITPKKIQWVVPTENTLIDAPLLNLSTDEATGERRFTGETFPLAIKETYSESATNNQVTVIATHQNGTEYRQLSNLTFTKIGENGTNGTETVLKITELVTPQTTEELLTIIKNYGAAGFWNNEDHSPIETTSALGVGLYTNNTENVGYTTTWTMAGSSKSYGRNYSLNKNEAADGTVTIGYVDEENTEVDSRIAEAEVNFGSKYYYNYYGIPAIEYTKGYDYDTYPIKVMRDGTLRSVLYSSDGSNPTYDTARGVHLDVEGWPQTGYFQWKVVGGSDEDHPNMLLARTANAKKGSTTLTVEPSDQELIITTRDTIAALQERITDGDVKHGIETLTADINNIANDSTLSAGSKLDGIEAVLKNYSTEHTDSWSRQVYVTYNKLYAQMRSEFSAAQAINEEYSTKYNSIVSIWQGEWPSMITDLHLSKEDKNSYADIYAVINAYKGAYEDRNLVVDESDKDRVTKREMPTRDIYDETFQQYLDYMDDLRVKDGSATTIWNKLTNTDTILIEYTKVLMAYMHCLFTEARAIYDKDNNDNFSSRYYNADSNWFQRTVTIGEDYYYDFAQNEEMTNDFVAALNESGENITVLTQALRDLFLYNQAMMLNVAQYEVQEESSTLNDYIAIVIKGRSPEILDQVYIIPNSSFNGVYQNNNVIATAYIQSNKKTIEIAKVYIPIVMTLNTYELASLNGWDGTALEINEDEGYITTPQIGAGIKDSKTNSFTGMVMGAIGNPDSNNYNDVSRIGLAGYSAGRQSIFMDSTTGKVTLGMTAQNDETSEGQIVLNPLGESSIANWKIGSRYLANVVDGSTEKRKDSDARSSKNSYRLMVPHDKQGIVLSAEQPYIDIKGKPFDFEDVASIDFDDYNNILGPNDSLELRFNPGNNSLFSIVQHTSGIDETDTALTALQWGYCQDITATPRVVNTVASRTQINAEDEENENAGYYLFYIPETDGAATPYYQKLDNSTSPYKWRYPAKANSGNVILDAPYISVRNSNGTYGGDINIDTVKEAFSVEKITGDITVSNTKLAEAIVPRAGYDRYHEQLNYSYTNKCIEGSWEYKGDYSSPTNNGKKIMRILTTRYLTAQVNQVTLNLEASPTGGSEIDTDDFVITFYLVESPTDDSGNVITYNSTTMYNSEIVSSACYKSETVSFSDVTSNQKIQIPLSLVDREFVLQANRNYDLWYIVTAKDKEFTLKGDWTWPVSAIGETYVYPIGWNGAEDTRISDGVIISRPDNISKEAVRYNGAGNFETDTNKTGSYSYSFNDSKLNSFAVAVSGQQSTYDVIVIDMTNKDDISNCIIAYGRALSRNQKTTLTMKNPISLSDFDKIAILICQSGSIQTYTTTIETQNSTSGSSSSSGNDSVGSSGTTTTQETTIVFPDVQVKRTLYFDIDLKYSQVYPICSLGMYFWTATVDMRGCKNFDYLLYDTGSETGGQCAIPFALTKKIEPGSSKDNLYFYPDYLTYVINNKLDEFAYLLTMRDNQYQYAYLKTIDKSTIKTLFEDRPTIEGITYNEDVTNFLSQTDDDWPIVSGEADLSTFKDNLSWKEVIRVGIDEGGRFFTDGNANSRSYSRVGKIQAFNKMINLKGLEVVSKKKTLAAISDTTNIGKIFFLSSAPTRNKAEDVEETNYNTHTTFITGGTDDDNSISIQANKSRKVEIGVNSDRGDNDLSLNNYLRVNKGKVSAMISGSSTSISPGPVYTTSYSVSEGLVLEAPRANLLYGNGYVQNKAAQGYEGWILDNSLNTNNNKKPYGFIISSKNSLIESDDSPSTWINKFNGAFSNGNESSETFKGAASVGDFTLQGYGSSSGASIKMGVKGAIVTLSTSSASSTFKVAVDKGGRQNRNYFSMDQDGTIQLKRNGGGIVINNNETIVSLTGGTNNCPRLRLSSDSAILYGGKTGSGRLEVCKDYVQANQQFKATALQISTSTTTNGTTDYFTVDSRGVHVKAGNGFTIDNISSARTSYGFVSYQRGGFHKGISLFNSPSSGFGTFSYGTGALTFCTGSSDNGEGSRISLTYGRLLEIYKHTYNIYVTGNTLNINGLWSSISG